MRLMYNQKKNYSKDMHLHNKTSDTLYYKQAKHAGANTHD